MKPQRLRRVPILQPWIAENGLPHRAQLGLSIHSFVTPHNTLQVNLGEFRRIGEGWAFILSSFIMGDKTHLRLPSLFPLRSVIRRRGFPLDSV